MDYPEDKRSGISYDSGLKTMLEGDLSSDIILRSYDEFKDVAQALDTMRGKNQERFRKIRSGFIDISQAVSELELDYEKGLPLEEKTEKVISLVKELRGEIPFEGYPARPAFPA